MANIADLLEKRKLKPFSKRNYRAWDLSGEAENSVDNSPSELVTKEYQSSNKLVTKEYQSSNQTGNEVVTETSNKVVTKEYQSSNKVVTKQAFCNLTGLQRDCMVLLYTLCKNSPDYITSPVYFSTLKDSLNSSKGTVKTTLNRLNKKGFIERFEFKNGRRGWSKYRILNSIAVEMKTEERSNKLITNWSQSSNKVVTLSSSSLNINTTTSGLWINIDIEPLERIGFTEQHLQQIPKTDAITDKTLQESIHAFAFDLYQNKRIEKGNKNHIKEPLNYFMKSLKMRGIPYAPPDNYESPQDIAMRRYLERQQELVRMREKTEQAARDVAYQNWIEGLSDDQRTSITQGRNPAVAYLKTYFIEQVWPTEKAKICI